MGQVCSSLLARPRLGLYLDDMPVELLHRIFFYCCVPNSQEPRKHNLKALSEVNKHLRLVVLPFLYENVQFSDRKRCEQFLQNIENFHGRALWVKSFQASILSSMVYSLPSKLDLCSNLRVLTLQNGYLKTSLTRFSRDDKLLPRLESCTIRFEADGNPGTEDQHELSANLLWPFCSSTNLKYLELRNITLIEDVNPPGTLRAFENLALDELVIQDCSSDTNNAMNFISIGLVKKLRLRKESLGCGGTYALFCENFTSELVELEFTQYLGKQFTHWNDERLDLGEFDKLKSLTVDIFTIFKMKHVPLGISASFPVFSPTWPEVVFPPGLEKLEILTFARIIDRREFYLKLKDMLRSNLPRLEYVRLTILGSPNDFLLPDPELDFQAPEHKGFEKFCLLYGIKLKCSTKLYKDLIKETF